MIEFNPNSASSPVIPQWASYVPGRCPEFKIHKRKGDAVGALSHHREGIVYEYEIDKWAERYRIDESNFKCGGCGWAPRNYSEFNRLRVVEGMPFYLGPWYCDNHIVAARIIHRK